MDERELIASALALGAQRVAGWSDEETTLVRAAGALPRVRIDDLREQIAAGGDPLGDAFVSLRTPEQRRPMGATYTPAAVVSSMVAWADAGGAPARVIDPGMGSGRFALAAGRRFPDAQLIGVELDPLAALVGRANVAAAGLTGRTRIDVADYRSHRPPPISGRTLYLGNPPYVRHHQIGPDWKRWLVKSARSVELRASQLAGLHVYFILATALHAAPADHGCFITSAEWLDVNYGSLVRDLLLGRLGGQSIHVLDPTLAPFEDAATTAAITCFRVGSRPRSVRMRRVASIDGLGALTTGRPIALEHLTSARRWTPLTRPGARRVTSGMIELGELCRVHRGSVTGANSVWIVAPARSEAELFSADALPAHLLVPAVTRARELFASGGTLRTTTHLRRVVDLPRDLETLEVDERRAVDRFIRAARRRGADAGYIARNRPAWWSVGLRGPAPILATYMARRPPVFVRNLGGARHVNIAHGLYPRLDLPARALDRLAAHLRESVTVDDGRTYAGGLTKFEPKEMERLLVPSLAVLTAA